MTADEVLERIRQIMRASKRPGHSDEWFDVKEIVDQYYEERLPLPEVQEWLGAPPWALFGGGVDLEPRPLEEGSP